MSTGNAFSLPGIKSRIFKDFVIANLALPSGRRIKYMHESDRPINTYLAIRDAHAIVGEKMRRVSFAFFNRKDKNSFQSRPED